MTRIEAVIDFLKKEFPDGIQMFSTRNVIGDYLYPIYEKDDVSIEYCSNWYYVEIFGLTRDEWDILTQCGEWDNSLDIMKKWY